CEEVVVRLASFEEPAATTDGAPDQDLGWWIELLAQRLLLVTQPRKLGFDVAYAAAVLLDLLARVAAEAPPFVEEHPHRGQAGTDAECGRGDDHERRVGIARTHADQEHAAHGDHRDQRNDQAAGDGAARLLGGLRWRWDVDPGRT